MVVSEIKESDNFKRIFRKLDESIRIKVKKIILKIIETPDIGKPMMYSRKGTRELYIKPFGISYSYDPHTKILCILDFYHKKKQ